MSISSSEQAKSFWMACREDLDAAPRLAFADWLEERGEEPLAHALRWMAYRRLWPHHRLRYYPRDSLTGQERRGRAVPEMFSHAWYPHGGMVHFHRDNRTPDHAFLPPLVYQAVGGLSQQRLSDSCEKACQRLADGLEKLKREWGY
jgi:uncharacterized protein (TIGR02996 family)